MYDIAEIIEKVDIVQYIGQYVNLQPKNGEWIGICPFHSEKTPSFTVTPTTQRYYCFGCRRGGTIINFVAEYHNISYYQAIQRLGEEYSINHTQKQLSNITKVLKSANYIKPIEVVTHPILDISQYDKYSKELPQEWVDEGISPRILQRYDIRIDNSQNRIVYPVHDTDGNLIGVKGRTRTPEWKLLGIPKYMNYYPVGTVDYLQGLHMKKSLIQNKGEIIIFEGIKSVMKADTYGYYHSVAAETCHLNEYQIRLILSLHCNVVLAFDSDVDMERLMKVSETLRRFTNVYAIYDNEHILGEKCSPVDMGKENWEYLYSNKILLQGGDKNRSVRFNFR